MLQSLSLGFDNLCPGYSGSQVSWLIPQRITPLDSHGVRTRHWQTSNIRLIVFFRFCSGGSCSDLVGPLVAQFLSIPESLCR